MKMKAVLFAGTGETPLYPITCTTPKLLLPIVGKPLLAHILETLYANHVKEVCLILPYDEMRVKEAVRRYTPQGLSVYFVFEQETKTHPYLQSLASQSEPICFLYGAHFFDFDLTDAKHLHCETDADITVLGTASDYLTDGVALVTDSSERITDTMLFSERHRPLSKLADSGVYLLRPEQLFAVLQICETAESASVLPHLLPCTAYVCAQNGYCNFLDTLAAFRACSRAVLYGETRYTPLHLANGIYASCALPNGKYQIIPPVWFGENVTVSDGAQIGPNTVLCDNSFIGTGACVAQSVVCSGVAVYQNAKLHGAVVCENAVIKAGASLEVGSVVGAYSAVGKYAAVGQGVRVWQQQAVENGMRVLGDVRFSVPWQTVFTENGQLHTQKGIDPILLAALGLSLGSCDFGKKVGILSDGSPIATAAARILSGTLSVAGSGVWDFGKGFLPQLYFYTSFCDMQVGIFLSHRKEKLCLQLFAAGGLMLSGAQMSSLQTRLQIGDFPATVPALCKVISDMHDAQSLYLRELLREAGVGLHNQSVFVQCPNAEITMLLEDALYRLQAKTGDEVTLRLSADGTRVTAFHRDCGYLPHERLLAICCNAAFESGQDVALCADAPFALEALAAKNGRRIFHYANCPGKSADKQVCALAREQLYVRDGLFLSMRLLGILEKSGKSLAELHRELPAFFVRRKSVPLRAPMQDLCEKLHLADVEIRDTGAVWFPMNGRVLLIPQRAGRSLCILAEANRFETAKALCEEVEERLTNH